MTVAREEPAINLAQSIGLKLKNQFIYKFLLVYAVFYGIIIFTDDSIFSNYPLLFTILTFGPLIPIWYAEVWWENQTQSPELQRQSAKIEGLRIDFYATGILMSMLLILISQVITLLLGSEILYSFGFVDTDPEIISTLGRGASFVPIYRLYVLLFFIIAILSGITAYKLIYTRYNGSNDLQNRLFNHPTTIITLMSYLIAGSMVSVLLLYTYQIIPDSESIISIALQNEFYKFSYHTFGSSLPIMIMVPMFIAIMTTFFVTNFPYILKGRNLNLSQNSNRLQIIVFGAIGLPLLYASFTYYMYLVPSGSNMNNLYFATIGIIMLALAGQSYLVNQSFTNKSQCQNCGYFGGEDCEYCNNEEKEYDYEIVGRNLKVPKCPNCKKQWNNLSRRCSNCKYTIVLTCENCSQTINPLWKKCNLCGSPRLPVPEVALTKPSDDRFAYIRARYILLVVLTIPFLIVDAMIFLRDQNLIAVTDQEFLATLNFRLLFYDNYRRWVIWGVFILTIAVLIIRTSNSENHQKLIMVDNFVTAVYSELIIVFLITVFFIVIQNLFETTLLFTIIAFIPLAVVGGIYYRRYRIIMQFDPYSVFITDIEKLEGSS